MTRVLSVFGTRPEAIKMAPVVHALEASSEFESRVCVTGQHRDMLDPVMELFDLRADHDLAVMRPSQTLTQVTSAVLLGMQPVLEAERPDVVLVHGDTTTTFAATVASFYARIPVGHVEAGLRTGNMAAPFPEEANRVLADHICRYHYAPTERSRENLLRDGIPSQGIAVTGNTVIDALLWIRERVQRQPLAEFREAFGEAWDVVAAPERPMVLVTGHRRESFGEGFENLCGAIRELATGRPDVSFVYPVHLNPRVRGVVHERLTGLANVKLLPPLDYAPFVRLLDRCTLVITDSGGIQEEAPSLGKPVLVTREVTERPEAVDRGTVILVGTDRERIVHEVGRLLDNREHFQRMTEAHNPYGDGQASARILAALTAAERAGDFAR